MRSFTIYLALLIFSLSTTAISDLTATDDAGVEHAVYTGEQLPNQGLSITEEQAADMNETSSKNLSTTDIVSAASFALFTLLPMLLSSMFAAFYVVGWLSAWGVPSAIAWVFQGGLWYLYGRDFFQIMSNRSLKAFE